jgi:hypothetical protein
MVDRLGLFQTYYQETLLSSYSASSISWIFTIQLCVMYVLFLYLRHALADTRTQVLRRSHLRPNHRYIWNTLCSNSLRYLNYPLHRTTQSLHRVLSNIPSSRFRVWHRSCGVIFVCSDLGWSMVPQTEGSCFGNCGCGK